MNSKNDCFKTILVICFGFFLVSCQLGISMVEGTKWLDSKNDRPEINIAGAWAAEDWGAATFRQEGKDITGVLGDYPVKGVVSGTSVYLLMYNKDRAEYFAELKASDDKTLVIELLLTDGDWKLFPILSDSFATVVEVTLS